MTAKNVIILKQLEEGFSTPQKKLNGLIRLENDSGVSEISLSLVNVSSLSGGKYVLFIFGENSLVYTFDLPLRPVNFRKSLPLLNGTENGFACSLVAVRSDIPLTVAFGKTENFPLSVSDAKKLVAERCILERKQRPTIIETPTTQYDDEAVATVNYFELEQSIKTKTERIKKMEDDKLSDENGNAFSDREKEEKEIEGNACLLEDETHRVFSKEQEHTPFYLTKLAELDGIFKKFPPYDALCGFFPDSRWAKIYYDKERYYVVGLIKENGLEKYICYGVPGVYSPTPPKELKGYCQFIPLSIFNLNGDGFWMMFQDAITGNCIFPK